MISPQCTRGMHNFCLGTREDCLCVFCHLGPCERCGASNLLKMYDEGRLCAPCKREDMRATNRPHERCQQCGAEHAFRNPGAKEDLFLCLPCHQGNGDSLILTPGVQALAAACRTADENSPSHSWEHLRGHRYVCSRCGVKRYDKAKGGTRANSPATVPVLRP